MKATHEIATLHRRKYILSILGFIFFTALILSRIDIPEIAKIVLILCSLPLAFLIAIKTSYNPSVWTVIDGKLEVSFRNRREIHIALEEIHYVQNMKRSGGNLLAIHKENKQTIRIWRNKLFQREDDFVDLLSTLQRLGVDCVEG